MVAVDDLFRRSLTAVGVIYLLAGAAVIVGLVFITWALVHRYMEYRGKRLVVCPETEARAAQHVDMDAHPAAFTSLGGAPEPGGRLIRHLFTSWYAGKECVLCGRAFQKLPMSDRHALLSPEGNIVEREVVCPEAIPDVLATHKPVCRNCKGTWRLWSQRADMDTRQPHPR
jgi:hypothetical protein